MPVALLCVAQLRPRRTRRAAQRAFAAARAAQPALRLLLAGEGAQRAALEQQAARLALGDAVRFLGRREDVPALLAACDVLVLASRPVVDDHADRRHRGDGGARRAVRATRVGAVDEVVEDGVTGMLVPSEDVTALAAALGRLAGDAALRGRFAAAGHQRATERFDRRRMVAETAALLEGERSR